MTTPPTNRVRDKAPAWTADEDAVLRSCIGFEPDHWASSMEVTVLALWRTRKELAALKAKVAK